MPTLNVSMFKILVLSPDSFLYKLVLVEDLRNNLKRFSFCTSYKLFLNPKQKFAKHVWFY